MTAKKGMMLIPTALNLAPTSRKLKLQNNIRTLNLMFPLGACRTLGDSTAVKSKYVHFPGHFC